MTESNNRLNSINRIYTQTRTVPMVYVCRSLGGCLCGVAFFFPLHHSLRGHHLFGYKNGQKLQNKRERKMQAHNTRQLMDSPLPVFIRFAFSVHVFPFSYALPALLVCSFPTHFYCHFYVMHCTHTVQQFRSFHFIYFFIIYSTSYIAFIHLFFVIFHRCLDDGTWFQHPESNRDWSNYTTCVNVGDLEVNRQDHYHTFIIYIHSLLMGWENGRWVYSHFFIIFI